MTKVKIRRNVVTKHTSRRGIELDIASQTYTQTKTIDIDELARYLNAKPQKEASGGEFETVETEYHEWKIVEVVDEPASKVKLPKDVAKAINILKTCDLTNFEIVTEVSNNHTHGIYADIIYSHVNGDMDELMSALVNGYEVEKSPEDLVRSTYEGAKNWARNADHLPEKDVKYKLGVMDGIHQTLKAYGITVEGVND
jgi:hypothetical protein